MKSVQYSRTACLHYYIGILISEYYYILFSDNFVNVSHNNVMSRNFNFPIIIL